MAALPADALAVDALEQVLRSIAHLPFVAVLHLGAGRDDVLQAYGDHGAQALVLIDADEPAPPDAARRPGVQWVQACVSADGEPLAWRRYNLPHLDGPADLQPLHTWYPRLQQQALEARPSRSLASLVALLGEAPGPRLLVIDLPGQEAALLAGLPAEELQRFDWIVLRGCSALPGAAAADTLRAQGFRLLLQDRHTDPLWPVQAFEFDRLAQAERHWHSTEAAQQARQAELEQRAQALQADAGRLAVERDEARRQLHDATRRLGEEIQRLERLAAERADERNALRSHLTEQAAASARDEQVTRLEAELAEAREAQALAHKLQALREADLHDLQERYRDVSQRQQAQRELLVQLAQRLTAAQQYFQQLGHTPGGDGA